MTKRFHILTSSNSQDFTRFHRERRGKDVKHEIGTGLNDCQESLNTQRITFTRASNINKTTKQ